MTITIDKSTYDFFLAEAQQVHALCDRAHVPREMDGEPLSMAQRVAVLEEVLAGLVVRLGQDPLTTLH